MSMSVGRQEHQSVAMGIAYGATQIADGEQLLDLHCCSLFCGKQQTRITCSVYPLKLAHANHNKNT